MRLAKLAFQKSIVIVVFVALWEIAPRVGWVDPTFIPPVSQVLVALGRLLASGELLRHSGISLGRAFAGFAITCFLAIPLGFLVGWSRRFERYADPLLQGLRQLNVLSLFPVFILLLGIGETSRVFMIAFASFWSLFLNTVAGVKNTDPVLVKSARSMNVSNRVMFFRVVLPGAGPMIFAGLRNAAGIALILLVAAEMLGAQQGLGWAIINWQLIFQIPNMFAGIITLAVIGVVVNYVLVWIEGRLMHWKEDPHRI